MADEQLITRALVDNGVFHLLVVAATLGACGAGVFHAVKRGCAIVKLRFLVMMGHGRALETYLVGAKLWYGITLLFPGTQMKAIVLQDIWAYIPDFALGILFLILGAIQAVGLVLNLYGVESSWIWRVVGAHIAICLWSWLIMKSIAIGAIATGAFPFWGMSFLASTFILWKGYNRLPVPGAPGAT